MNARNLTLAFFLCLGSAGIAQAGDIYTITSADGKTTYKAMFGFGRAAGRFTGFDPETKQFVYIPIRRAEARPEPVAKIWDHKSGQSIALYKFPEVTQPLPIIPSIKELVYFPLSDSKEFTVKLTGNFD